MCTAHTHTHMRTCTQAHILRTRRQTRVRPFHPPTLLHRAGLPAVCSVPPVFSAQPRRVLVACLDGSLCAWEVAFHHTEPSQLLSTGPCTTTSSGNNNKNNDDGKNGSSEEGGSQSRQGSGPPCQPAVVDLSLVWRSQPPGAAPVFATPAVDNAARVVVVAHVDGTVRGVCLGSGRTVRGRMPGLQSNWVRACMQW